MSSLIYSCKKFDELDLTELYHILQLRQEVFIIEQNCPYLDADSKDFEAYHLMGKDLHGQIQAYTRLLPAGVSYPGCVSIGRVLTSLKLRKEGHGKKLMELSIEKIKELFPGYPVKISAQMYLLKFYRNLGFIETGKYYPEDGIPHAEMILDIQDFPK